MISFISALSNQQFTSSFIFLSDGEEKKKILYKFTDLLEKNSLGAGPGFYLCD